MVPEFIPAYSQQPEEREEESTSKLEVGDIMSTSLSDVCNNELKSNVVELTSTTMSDFGELESITMSDIGELISTNMSNIKSRKLEVKLKVMIQI